MPNYTFKCEQCQDLTEQTMTISEFLVKKHLKINCEKCLIGVLSHQITSINVVSERSQDQIDLEIQDEVRKTVDKINAGDQRAFEDIYGDRINPHKKC